MIFKQSKSFYLIFILELLERFSFYGLQSIIIIYLIKKIYISEKEAINIFSSFNSIIYILIIITGWISDKIIGSKRILLIGIITLILGYTFILINKENINLLIIGLSIICIGNSLFKPNSSLLLTNIYNKNKKYEKDSGFTIYYMSTNIGSFLSIIISPIIINLYGWKITFLIPIISLLLTLIIFIKFNNLLNKYGTKADFKKINKKKILLLLISIIILIPIIFYLIKNINIINNILKIIIILITIIFIKKITLLNNKEKKKIIVFIILIIESIIFFILYNLIPTYLNLFTIKNVKHYIFNIYIKPEQFQALNPFWIIIFSPILSYIYKKINKKFFSIIYKFNTGIILSSISFLMIPIGIYFSKDKNNLIPSYWIILSYAFQSLGELMISGLGISMICQIVPKKILKIAINIWFLSSSISNILSGKIANMMLISKENNLNSLQSLNIYYYNFLKISIYTFIISIFMIIISKKINYIIEEK